MKFLTLAAILTAVTVALACFVITDSDESSAAGDDDGDCGTDLKWEYTDATKTLKITGLGTTMDDYDHDMYPHDWPSDIKIIDMSGAQNMTNIGKYAFYECNGIEKVIFGPKLSTVGNNAFTCGAGPAHWDLSFCWHNGNVFDSHAISAADMAGRTFQLKEGAIFWMTDVKVGDPLILDSKFKGTITEVYSQNSCSVRVDGFMPGKSLPSDGTLTLSTNGNIWTNKAEQNPWMSALITSIGDNAFAGLTDLKNLDVGANNKSIGAGAFKDCKNLKELTVSINVDLSTGKPFEGCSNIEKITFRNGVGTQGKGFDYSIKESAPIKDTPMHISKDKLSTVILPSGLKEIGKWTFYECTALSEIVLPDGLEIIDEYAFSRSGLVSVSTPQSLKTIEKYAFYSCNSLTSAEIRGTELFISGYAFYECRNLSSLTLAEGVHTIDGLAFYDIGISTAEIPDSLSSLVSRAFNNSKNLSAFKVKDTNTRFSVDERGVLYSKDGKDLYAVPCKLEGTYKVADGVTKLPNDFMHCQVSNVILPSSITSINFSTFQDCMNLKSVEAVGATSIGKWAFLRVTSLTDLYVPALKTVDAEAFKNGVTFWDHNGTGISCDSDSFKRAGFWSGNGNGKLYSGVEIDGITYQKGLADKDGSISAQAVSCGDLKDVIIPDTVTIGSAQYKVTDIRGLLRNNQPETLFIGANVAKVNQSLDSQFIVLMSIDVSPDNATYASFDGMLYSKDLKTLLRCPVDRTAVMAFASDLENIGDYAFYNCKNTSGLVLPIGLKNIGSNAFGYYPGNSIIGSFTLPSTLESIGSNAFPCVFYNGDMELSDATDVRGHSWMLNAEGNRYIMGVAVPEPVDGNISFDAPYVFDLNSSAIESMNGNSVTVNMGSGTVVFSPEAAAGLKAGTLTIGSADTSGYSDELKTMIGDRPVFTIAFGENKDFAGTVTVTLPYALREGEDAGNIHVAFVNSETNELEDMGGIWSAGYVTFTTSHFSDYAIMNSESSGSGDSGSNTMLFVGIGVVAVIAVLFIALYFLHIGPFARKN